MQTKTARKTPASISDLHAALTRAVRLADMSGEAYRSRTLEAHAYRVESIDPVYAQTEDSAPVIAKARRALRAAL